MIKRFKTVIKERQREASAMPVDDIIISGEDLTDVKVLKEGKWLSAEYEDDMRVDRNKHLHSADKHAHFFDRKGNELYAMTADGKPSHGSKPFKLTKAQAAGLEGEGFTIPKNRVVEGVLNGSGTIMLLS